MKEELPGECWKSTNKKTFHVGVVSGVETR